MHIFWLLCKSTSTGIVYMGYSCTLPLQRIYQVQKQKQTCSCRIGCVLPLVRPK